MRKKITSKTLEKMLLEFAARKRIAGMDSGTYFPLQSRSSNAKNPCAEAMAKPGVRVEFEILSEPPVTGSVVWDVTATRSFETTRLNSKDFWLKSESTFPSVEAKGGPDEEDRSPKEPEFEEPEDLVPPQLDREFKFTFDSTEFEVFDIQTKIGRAHV